MFYCLCDDPRCNTFDKPAPLKKFRYTTKLYMASNPDFGVCGRGSLKKGAELSPPAHMDRLHVHIYAVATICRAGGAMNSGPIGSLTLSRTIRQMAFSAAASSFQPSTLSTVCSCSGWRAPHKATLTPG